MKINRAMLVYNIRMWLVFIFGAGFICNVGLALLAAKSQNMGIFWGYFLTAGVVMWCASDLMRRNRKMIKIEEVDEEAKKNN